MDTLKIPIIDNKYYISRENSPSNDKSSKNIDQKKPFNDYNDEIILMLEKIDLKQFSISSLEMNVEQLKQKYVAIHGEDFLKKANSLSSVFNSIKKLIERSFKQIFKLYNKQMQQYGVPKKNDLLIEIQDYLDQNVISSKLSDELDSKIKKSILTDCQIFVYILTQIPGMYVEFFEKDFFGYLENIDIIGEEIDLHLCREVLKRKVMEQVKNMLSINSDFIITVTSHYIHTFIDLVNSIIAYIFQQCKSAITQYISDFKKVTEKATLVNRFIIIGLLKELSHKCRSKITLILNSSFYSLIDPEITQNFASFIIQSNELFDLKYDSNFDASQYFELDNEDLGRKLTLLEEKEVEEKSLQLQIQEKIQMVMKPSQKLIICNLVRKDGHHGYLIEIQEEGKSYLIHKNMNGRVVILNAKFMCEGWMKQEYDDSTKTLKSFDQLLQSVKDKKTADFLSEDGKNLPPPDLNKSGTIYMNSAAGDLGSSLGYCLANINKYESTTDFLKDFGKIATINGSITYIVQKLPLVGTLLMVGGLGFSTVMLYKNKVANGKSKMGQLGKMALGTGSAITGSFSGALLGQAIIPIPVLGAFIGGVIGGIIGGTSSNYAIQMLNKSKFNLMIAKIEQSLVPEGMWYYSRDMLNKLGITNQFFQKSLPESLSSTSSNDRQDIWITLCCYGMLSTYYSSVEQKERQKLQKQLDKSKDEKEQEEIAAQLEYSQEWNPVIQRSQNWILEKGIPVVLYLSQMEEFIKAIISHA